ncbi:MAG: hypothetical protein M1834_002988 [Cirrosporium novae-zelandiae]|nr:MAG: hypothetical protein M1834_002988 [Cirrosporium novae-zelandiae]
MDPSKMQDTSTTTSPTATAMFGYTFDFPEDASLPPPPPPGPSLLDDSESHMLNNFFDDLGHGQPPTGYSPYNFGEAGNSDHNLPFDFDLPPTFEGSTTSLPQPTYNTPTTFSHSPLPMLDYDNRNHVNIPNPIQIPATTTSAEVLAAASTLMRNGQTSHLNGTAEGSIFPTQIMENIFREPGFTNRPSASSRSFSYHGLSNGTMSINPDLTQSSRDFFPSSSRTLSLNDTMYPSSPQTLTTLPSQKKDGLVWGSDPSIGKGYDNVQEEVTGMMMKQLECLERQETAPNTANNTAPPSPNMTKRHVVTQVPTVQCKSIRLNEQVEVDEGEENIDEARPRKRRKSKYKEEDSSDEETFSRYNARKPKSISKSRRKPSTSEGLSSRNQKSTSPKNKPTRENLTEEQKRNNHIMSEQKRRNLIKKGYEEVCELVPGLKDGGLSKSAVLAQAAEWLEELLHGNQQLHKQLMTLKEFRGA